MDEYMKEWIYDLPDHQALIDKDGNGSFEIIKQFRRYNHDTRIFTIRIINMPCFPRHGRWHYGIYRHGDSYAGSQPRPGYACTQSRLLFLSLAAPERS